MSLSVALRQQVVELLGQGHAAVQIAKTVGCSPGTVYGIKNELKSESAIEVQRVQTLLRANPTAIAVLDNPLNWASGLPSAIANGIEYLQSGLSDADNRSPRTITAVAGAVSTLAELQITAMMISHRLKG